MWYDWNIYFRIFTADTYVTEVMGSTEEIASSLADIFNGMVYDSTFLLIIMSAILALILGQEFSKRTINLEVSADIPENKFLQVK